MMKCPSCKDEITSLKMQEIMATGIDDANDRLFGFAWICPGCKAIVSITNKTTQPQEIAEEVIRRLNSQT